MSLPETKRIKL